MTNEERFAWFVTGWLSLAFLYWGIQTAQRWLQSKSPCRECDGDGFKIESEN